MSARTAITDARFRTSTSSQGGVSLHVVEGGPDGLGADAKARVVLLHGFPEHWATWRALMHDLVDDNFAVAAPDLRGYGGSDKPVGRGDYNVDALLDDVEAVIRMGGRDRAHVVAHDWGGVIGWWLAHKRPHLVDKLVIVNSPHPLLFLQKLTTPLQVVKSSYMGLFASPLAPVLLGAGDFALVRAMLKATARPKAYADDDVEGCVDALRGGGLDRALRYYRAMIKGAKAMTSSSSPSREKIAAPTLIVWGRDDPVLGLDLTDGIDRYVDDVRVVAVDRCSHWVQHDAPAELSRAVLDHFGR